MSTCWPCAKKRRVSWEFRPMPGVEENNPHGRNNGISYPDALVMLPGKPDMMFTAGAAASPGSSPRFSWATM